MKKLLSALLSVFTVFSATMAFAMEPDAQQLEDLKKFNIMVGDENGDLHLDSNITRAEAVKMVVAMSGNKSFDDSYPKEPVFEDVTEYHWAYDYIKYAKGWLVNGDGNGYFHPDDPITNEELVKMIVCMLGFEPMADQSGGWPAGYIVVGSINGITRDLILEIGAAASRSDAAIMIYRALDAPHMEMTSANTGDGTREYSVFEEPTLRSRLEKEVKES